jgi:hypothetical protein
MAYLITRAGSGEVQSGFITRGHRDYPPDKGGKSFHYRNCTIEQAGSGSYGTRWRCDRLQPSEIWIPIGQPSPYPIGDDPTKNCKQSATTTYKQWGGRRKGGHKSTCAYGMVFANIKAEEMASARAACTALAEGQQLRDQPHGMKWKHKDVRRAAAGSSGDLYMAYPTRPTRGNLRLHCWFKDPLPSKNRPFQERQRARLLASGARFLTEAEKEEYASLCPPKTSSAGIEVPRKPVWKRKIDRMPFNPLITRTDIAEGEHELRCYPDLSGLEVVIDPTLSQIRREEALVIGSQLTAEEEAEREERQQQLREHLERGEEQEHPWHVRYRIPLMLLGGMIVLGGGAALVQRVTRRKKATSNPDAYRYPIDEWPADYRKGVMDAWDDHKKKGPEYTHERWNALRGPLKGTFSKDYVDGYHDGFDASLGMSMAIDKYKRSQPKKNPTFLFTVGINGTGRTIKIKAPTITAAKKVYDRKYRRTWGPAYVRPATPRERM